MVDSTVRRYLLSAHLAFTPRCAGAGEWTASSPHPVVHVLHKPCALHLAVPLKRQTKGCQMLRQVFIHPRTN